MLGVVAFGVEGVVGTGEEGAVVGAAADAMSFRTSVFAKSIVLSWTRRRTWSVVVEMDLNDKLETNQYAKDMSNEVQIYHS